MKVDTIISRKTEKKFQITLSGEDLDDLHHLIMLSDSAIRRKIKLKNELAKEISLVLKEHHWV